MRRFVVTGLACCVLPVLATAEDAMRCGSRLIQEGDGMDKVRTLCGEPTAVTFGGVVRGWRHVPGRHDFSFYGPTWVDLPVEIWTYNLGTSKLLRKLRFEGDALVEIRTDGYGY
ncbi:MAG: DUF2845 domain-containing protein [Steroidobacteraceae bacterium]|nr:DUF2845 domain-containing protein [Steroidobacteraceae bacterium]